MMTEPQINHEAIVWLETEARYRDIGVGAVRPMFELKDDLEPSGPMWVEKEDYDLPDGGCL